MWRWEDVKMWRWEDVKMWRWEDVKMWRWEDVKMRRCEDEQMWRWEDVKMRRCEDEQMWRWEDVKMWGWEDVRMWGWEDVKIWRCYVKMWRCENVWQTPTIRRNLRSDALGKKTGSQYLSCITPFFLLNNYSKNIYHYFYIWFYLSTSGAKKSWDQSPMMKR